MTYSLDLPKMELKIFKYEVVFAIDMELEDVLSYLDYLEGLGHKGIIYPLYTKEVDGVPDFSEIRMDNILTPLYLPSGEQYLPLIKKSLMFEGEVIFTVVREKYQKENTDDTTTT